MEGYDHILDVVDEEGVSITDVITQRSDTEMSNLLASIPDFEVRNFKINNHSSNRTVGKVTIYVPQESRDILQSAVRRGDLAAVKSALAAENSRVLVRSQNSFSRTVLHIAVLAQHEDVVAYLAQTYPELLRIGDNVS